MKTTFFKIFEILKLFSLSTISLYGGGIIEKEIYKFLQYVQDQNHTNEPMLEIIKNVINNFFYLLKNNRYMKNKKVYDLFYVKWMSFKVVFQILYLVTLSDTIYGTRV
mmetsp:Transcript_24532/g.36791  ORF Transcript_24532/g.36791 Transcript_24532/m.36791 type:complete len:108 (-) Transcript_24532:2265-2588(-)